MPVKTFNTRIKNKIDLISNLGSFVPLSGEITIGGYSGSTPTTLGTNSADSPYLLKIGDGTTIWPNLPAVGTIILYGENGSITQVSSQDTIAVNLPADKKEYLYVEIAQNANITELNVSITGTNPFLGEHYILINNLSAGDVYLDNITATFGSTAATVRTRHDWITAGDICELQMKVYKIQNNYCITVIPQLGISQSVVPVGTDNVWNVNRPI